jgi:hypothetical protein
MAKAPTPGYQVSHLRSGPCIYIPQEQGGPAGFGSSLYSLGSNPTENSVSIVITQQYLCCYRGVFTSPLHRNGSSSIVCVLISLVICLPSRCLAMNVYSASAIPAFRRHVFSALRVFLAVDISYDLFVLIKLNYDALHRHD